MEGGRYVQIVVLRQLRGGVAEAAIEDERPSLVDDEERLQTHWNVRSDDRVGRCLHLYFCSV